MFDIIIERGRVIDGTASPWFVCDVAIANGRIAAMGKLDSAPTKRRIDAAGKVVCPGFIDAHAHSELAIMANPRHESRTMQGFTTEVLGMCGLSVAPSTTPTTAAMNDYYTAVLGRPLPADASFTVAQLLDRLDRQSAVNVAYCVPHATLRVEAAGMRAGPVTEAEMAKMKALLAQAMADGACGMSTGLMYFPSSEADTAELVELSRVVAECGGVYTTHMRNYGDDFAGSLEEVITIGREANLPVHVSHFRMTAGAKGRADEFLARLDQARAEGIDITCDCYPYLLGCTVLTYYVLAMEAYDGGKEKLLAKLRDPAQRAALQRERPEGFEHEVFIGAVASEANREAQGLSLHELAERRGTDYYNACCDLLVEEKLLVTAIGISADEDDLRQVMRHPASMLGSDSVPVDGRCHPRVFGAAGRYLAKYVLGEKLMRLEEAIRKMTSFPALRHGLTDRGALKVGLAADVVVFDPATLRDKATYEEPRQHPDGIEHVIVNGEPVVSNGTHTGATPGRAMR